MLGAAVRQPLRLRGHAEGGRGAPGRAGRPRAAAAAALPGAHGALRARRPEPALGAGQEAHPAAALGGGGGELHRGAALRGLPRAGAGRQQGAAAPVTRPGGSGSAAGRGRRLPGGEGRAVAGLRGRAHPAERVRLSGSSLGKRPGLTGAGCNCPPRGSSPPVAAGARRCAGLRGRGLPRRCGGRGEQAALARSRLRSAPPGGGPGNLGNGCMRPHGAVTAVTAASREAVTAAGRSLQNYLSPVNWENFCVCRSV